ncbi:DsrH/TusB family sulfur metabolism protein [Methanolobus halotolerans]|nr:DsrH/TusB family sulfur metabolism protein [Methanolobus halotolerans]
MSKVHQKKRSYENGGILKDVFLLTKSPDHVRTRLCWRLITQSENVVLYLTGDGVYNLLCPSVQKLPPKKILVCKEDQKARGVQIEGIVITLIDFYDRMIEDIMDEKNKVYVF